MNAAKAAELAAVQKVARARGNVRVEQEPGPWPDAWLEDATTGQRTPVEVVIAVERPPSEAPAAGSAVLREWKRIAQEADRLSATDGHPRMYGVHVTGSGAAGYISDLTDTNAPRLPLPSMPLNAPRALEAAVRQKMAKRYGPAASTVLVIDYRGLAPEPWEVTDLADLLNDIACPFPEVWITPELIASQAPVAMRVR